MSLLNSDDGFPGTGLAPALFGQTGAVAAARGAEQQTSFSRQALDLLRGNLAPFREVGVQAGAQAQALADPTGQAQFLAQSPLFANLSEQRARDIFASQASKGKLESGGTAEEVQSQIIQLGDQLINQQVNRLLPLVNLGQASAARQGAGSVDLLTGIGNAQAAGQIGAQNSLSQGAGNMAQLAAIIGGAVGGNNGQ